MTARHLCTSIILSLVAIQATAIELDQSPAVPGEWGYRPTSVDMPLNPPAFTWRPTSGADSYRLEIAHDKDFSDVVYSVETRWSSHCPSTTLPTGKLYWRYRAADATGVSAWSTIRSFSVATDATPYPQPLIDELMARIPTERPRLFMRPDDLPRLRALAKGSLADASEAVLARAEKVLANPPDMSEPPLYPAGTKRLSEPWKKIWWGNRTRGIAVADGAATLGFAYRITGDRKYGQAARDMLMAITEWDPEGSTQYKYNDEAAMPLMYMTSRAYDWAYPFFSKEDHAKVIEMMTVRGRQCYNHLKGSHLWKPYGSHSNRAWHWLAELSTEFYDDIPEAWEWLEFSMTVYFTAYPVWSDNDGGWHEGTAYWSSYVGRFMHWSSIMKSAYGIDAFDKPYFDNAGDLPLYLMPLGTQHGGFGDQAPKVTSQRAAPLMAVLAAGARNPYWQWYAEQHGVTMRGGYLDFFNRAASDSLESVAPADLPTARLFEGTGVAVMNTNLLSAQDNVQLLFKSSPLGRRSHGYNANNSFHLNVNGKPLLQGTGRRDVHGSPHHRNWMHHTKSQNAILVDGEGQLDDRYASMGRITHFEQSDDRVTVVGEAGAAYEKLDRWTRRLIFLKPDIIVIHDIIEAPEPVTIQWLLHAPGQFEITPAEQRTRYAADHGSVDVQILSPTDLELSQHDQYDPPPHDWAKFNLDEWHYTANQKDAKKNHEFIAVMRINNSEVPVAYSEDGNKKTLRVEGPNGPTNIVLDPSMYTN